MGRTGAGKRTAIDILTDTVQDATGSNLTETHFENGVFEDETAGICIISPNQLSEIIDRYPNMMFMAVYLKAEFDDDRKLNYIEKMTKDTPSDKKLLLRCEQEFDSIDEQEDAVFCQFEDKYYNADPDSTILPANLHMLHLVGNNYNYAALAHELAPVGFHYLLCGAVVPIVKESADLGIVSWADDDKTKIVTQEIDGQFRNLTVESTACLLTEKPTEFGQLMLDYILLSKRFSDINHSFLK